MYGGVKLNKKLYFSAILAFFLVAIILIAGCNTIKDKKVNEGAENKESIIKTVNQKLVKAPFYDEIPGLANIEAREDFDWKQFSGLTLNFVCESNIYANVLSKEAEQFSKITGITVIIHPMDYNTMIEKINLDFVSKADKYQIVYADPHKTLNRFSDNFVDLKKFNSNPALPHIPGGIEDFLEMQVDVDSYFLNRDKLYTIPFDSTTMILFYRKDIFEKYAEKFKAEKGYDWTPGSKDFTWERYCEIAAWINKNVPDNEVEFGCGQQAALHNSLFCDFSNVLASYGGNYFNEKDVGSIGVKNPGKSSFSDSQSIKALEIYKRINEVAHPSSLSWDWSKLADAFYAGEIAMMANWDEYSSSIENPEKSKVVGKVGYSILPYGSVRSANIFGGTGIGINNMASEVEQKAAWLFIIWATSPQTELLVLTHPEGGDIPSRRSVYTVSEVKDAIQSKPDILKKYPTMTPLPAVLKAWENENSYLRPKLKNSLDIEMIIIDELHKMLVNKGDPAETAKSITKQIDDFTGGEIN
jgi:ABC-type sugar transport system, periplasmic component